MAMGPQHGPVLQLYWGWESIREGLEVSSAV